MKTNHVAGRDHFYLMFRHFSTFNDHWIVWTCRTVPRLTEMLPEAFLNVDSKAGLN